MNRDDRDIKRERSLPVQSRVNLVSLAKLDHYFAREGFDMRTMSQLVAWGIDLVCEIIESNGKMPKGVETLEDAHRYLSARGLYQRSLKERHRGKLSTSLRMETLRAHGVDPKMDRDGIGRQFDTLHKGKHSAAFDGEVSTMAMTSDEEWAEIQRRIEEDKIGNIEDVKEAVLEEAKASGSVVVDEMTEEEFHDGLRKRDKDVIEQENKPVDELDFPIAKE